MVLSNNPNGNQAMLSFLPGPVKGSLTLLLYIVNTIVVCPALFATGLLKAIVPWGPWRRFWGRAVANVCAAWAVGLNVIIWLTNKIEWDISLPDGLKRNKSYIVLANHQSWADILILEKVLVTQVPFLRYFLKIELFWVPILNFGWWALDFPFVRRYSKETLAKKPHLKGKDIEITRKSCEKFKKIPVAIMNFVEGTRFRTYKHEKQNSPYKNLLLPRAGGIALALSAMGEQLTAILDLTIVYHGGAKTFWQFMCGQVKKVSGRVESMPVSPELFGDYFEDPEFKDRFQNWLNGVWAHKDKLIDQMKG